METVNQTKRKFSKSKEAEQQQQQPKPRCINWSKEGHRDTPVTKYDGYYLCVDCKDELKINRWFEPIYRHILSLNVEQLQDWPGRIMPDGILWGTKVKGFNDHRDPKGWIEEEGQEQRDS